MLQKHVLPNLRTAINQPHVFMLVNAPRHTAKTAKIFLSEEDTIVMELPLQRSDMNPTAIFLKLLNKGAKEKNPENVEEVSTISLLDFF